MQATNAELLPEHGRAETRTNMFVIASMSALTASGPIKIRNLSRHGALIEGAALPGLGEHLKLRKGPVCATGRIVRLHGNKAGVRFDGPINAAHWLPSGHPGQQRVDDVFHSIKADSAVCAEHQDTVPSTARTPADPAQLRQLALELNSLADVWAGDASVVVRHGLKLQTLDVASQMLRRLAGEAQNR
jgi:hypothetical protein